MGGRKWAQRCLLPRPSGCDVRSGGPSAHSALSPCASRSTAGAAALTAFRDGQLPAPAEHGRRARPAPESKISKEQRPSSPVPSATRPAQAVSLALWRVGQQADPDPHGQVLEVGVVGEHLAVLIHV